jgi:hypothetical protein
LTDVDADALKDLVRRANFLPYLSYGSPHDLSILEKISGYYLSTSFFRAFSERFMGEMQEKAKGFLFI